MIHEEDKAVFVQLPEGATNERIEQNATHAFLVYWLKDGVNNDFVKLPPNYTYNPNPTWIKNMSEEQADEVMSEYETSDGDGQILYPNFEGKASVTESSKASLRSLLRSKGMNPDNSICLIKINEKWKNNI